jgi:hypothetical protein
MSNSTRRAALSSTDSDWAKGLLREIIHVKVEKAPPGFYTARQWAEMWEISRDCATKHIRKAIDQGLMEQRNIKIACDLRSPYPVPHFAPVKGKVRSVPRSLGPRASS